MPKPILINKEYKGKQMAENYKLYGYYRSSTSYRVRILANLKNIDIELVDVNLIKNGGEQHLPEFRALNPQGIVPVLQLPNGDVLTQSPAILEYLDAIFPQQPMMPIDLIARAKIQAMMNLIACEIHPVNNLRILKYLKGTLDIAQGDVDIWYKHWVVEGFDALEKLVGDQGFCFGNNLTMADIYFMPQLYNARRFEVDLSPYPKLLKIEAQCNKIDAFIAAHPDKHVG